MTATSSDKEDLVQVQSDIRDGVDRERLKRHQREKKKNEELEEALKKLSSFGYSPVDYTAGLVRKQFVSPPIPDYSYLLTEARLKVANKYTTSIVILIFCGLICVILSLAFRDTILPVFGVSGLLICAISLYQVLLKRKRNIQKALTATRMRIDALIKETSDNIATAKNTFEADEADRIGKIEKLLSGDSGAIFGQTVEILQNIRLPFFLCCTVDFYKEPLITLHLPDRSIIPENIVSITSAGNLAYEEKSPLAINNQYSEVLAATAITIASLLYAAIPTLDNLTILGLFDKWTDEKYLFGLNTTRQVLLDAVKCHSGLEAFNMLNATYSIKTGGSLIPIQPTFPQWWDNTPREKIMSLKVNCHELS